VRRRRNNGAPVTFFSFQDVMLSLIGITIVITLILVLQVTDSAVAVLKRTGGAAGRAAQVEEQNRALSARVAALEYAVREAQKRPDGDPLAKRASLRQELVLAAGKLDDLERQADELVKQLRELTLQHPEAGALVQLTELVRMRDELLAELQTLERRRRISYLIDANNSARPILLEVSGTRIVACDLSADGVAIRIASGTSAAQVNDALEFYRTIAAGQQSYVLLVVKPSGIAQYWSIRAAIDALPESSRPAIGLDLIPEDAFVSELFPSALIGGAS
jgi:FAD/FMN-containing dehydrogenase